MEPASAVVYKESAEPSPSLAAVSRPSAEMARRILVKARAAPTPAL